MKVKEKSDLRNFEIFSFLNDEELEKFEKSLFVRTYKKNQVLFTEGDPRERLFFLRKGFVKLEKVNADATMLYVDYVKPHNLFPYAGMYHDKFYNHSAIAVTDIVVYYIPTKIFESLSKSNKDQLYVIIDRLSKILKKNRTRLQTLTTSNVRTRVEQAVTLLADEFGIKDGDDTVINIPMTVTEIAKIAGTSRETASHVFQELKCDHLLSMESRKIYVHDINYFREKQM